VPDPLYRKIAEHLQKKIEAGDLGGFTPDGNPVPLPSEGDLGKEYGASRNTIRDAIRWLANRRLIETRPGQGTFVVRIDPFVIRLNTTNGFGGDSATYASEIAAAQRRARVSEPRIEIQQAAALVAHELGLGADDTVLIRHQQRFIDDRSWSLQTTFYPMALVARGASRLIEATDIPQGAVRYLEEDVGVKQVGFRDELRVRAPESPETAFFDLPDDGSVAVFETRRTGYEKDYVPLRLTVTIFPVDRNQFVFNVGDVPGWARAGS
jgi:GntR family transcriptional regulator